MNHLNEQLGLILLVATPFFTFQGMSYYYTTIASSSTPQKNSRSFTLSDLLCLYDVKTGMELKRPHLILLPLVILCWSLSNAFLPPKITHPLPRSARTCLNIGFRHQSKAGGRVRMAPADEEGKGKDDKVLLSIITIS